VKRAVVLHENVDAPEIVDHEFVAWRWSLIPGTQRLGDVNPRISSIRVRLYRGNRAQRPAWKRIVTGLDEERRTANLRGLQLRNQKGRIDFFAMTLCGFLIPEPS
jgi:hypothetical protein